MFAFGTKTNCLATETKTLSNETNIEFVSNWQQMRYLKANELDDNSDNLVFTKTKSL